MAVIRQTLIFLALIVTVGLAQAAIEMREFDDPVMEKRYRELTASLRCPLCENQAIDDSDSPISADMRERVYVLIKDGRSDIEILDFMTNRFGDYVLYNPRLEGRTLLLWGLPAGLVILGGLLVAIIVRNRRQASARELTDAERQRLDDLINRKRTS